MERTAFRYRGSGGARARVDAGSTPRNATGRLAPQEHPPCAASGSWVKSQNFGLRGNVRNLPTAIAHAALNPPVALTFLDPQGRPDDGWIGYPADRTRRGGGRLTVQRSSWTPNQDIQTGQELAPLIDEGVFSEIWVLDEDALIDGAITTLDQLRGTTALVDIPSNHQISANHLEQLDEPTP